MAQTRVYVVSDRLDDGAGVRLVEATSGAAALRHIAEKRYEARPAKVDDMRKHRDMTIETAGEEPTAS